MGFMIRGVKAAFVVCFSMIVSLHLVASTLIPGAPVEHFKLPMFGSNGWKTWELTGDKGTPIAEDKLQIEGLRMVTYAGDDSLEPDVVLVSAQADLDTARQVAESTSVLRIQGSGYNAIGEKWQWRGLERRIRLHDAVRVTFEPSQTVPQYVIVSDQLDMVSCKPEHHFDFSGNIRVDSTDFWMTCDQLHVVSHSIRQIPSAGALDSVRSMVATGNVIMEHEGRKAMAGKAELDPIEGTLILTDNPRVEDTRGIVTGQKITFLKGQQQAVVEGVPNELQARPKVILNQMPRFDVDAVAPKSKSVP